MASSMFRILSNELVLLMHNTSDCPTTATAHALLRVWQGQIGILNFIMELPSSSFPYTFLKFKYPLDKYTDTVHLQKIP